MSSMDLCRQAGISYRQCDYWIRTGILVPVEPSGGSGTSHRFAPREVALATTIRRLLGAGASLQAVRPIVDGLRAAIAGDAAWVSVSGDDVVVEGFPDPFPASAFWVVSLAAVDDAAIRLAS